MHVSSSCGHNLVFYFHFCFSLTLPLQPVPLPWGQFAVLSGGSLETAHVPVCVLLEKGLSPCCRPLSWERPPADVQLQGKCKPGFWAPREEWNSNEMWPEVQLWVGFPTENLFLLWDTLNCLFYILSDDKPEILDSPYCLEKMGTATLDVCCLSSTAMVAYTVMSVLGR